MTTNTKIAAVIYVTTLGIMLYYNLTHPVVNDGVKEYQTFLLNLDHGWEFRRTLVNSCLVTTWFPAMLAKLTSLDAMTLFRIVPPLFYALMPMFTYLIARRYLATRYAVIACLVVLFNSHILFFPDIGRVGVGIAFFAGMLWALSERRLWLSILFALLVVFAHYGTALIASGLVLSSLFVYAALQKKILRQYLIVACVLLASTGIWHFWISSYSGWVMLTYGTQVELPQMTGDVIGPQVVPPQVVPPQVVPPQVVPPQVVPPEVTSGEEAVSAWSVDTFLDVNTREYAILRAFGLVGMTIPEVIEVIANWLVVGAVTLGLWLLLWRKQVDTMFKVLGALLWLLIVLTVSVPWLSQFYGGMRVYFTTLPILAAGFPVGLKWLVEKLKLDKIGVKPILACCAVLALLAVSTSGLIYKPFGEAKTFPIYWQLDASEREK